MMMLYKLFVKSLMAGSFAIHSAKLNNHNILKINNVALGHKVYECMKKDSFLATFDLEHWVHEEKIVILSDTKIEITDILRWSNCVSSRKYVVIDGDDAKRYVKEQWKVEYSGKYPLNNFIAGKIKSSLISADLLAFNTFGK